MAEEFSISPQMTKSQLIDEHQRLLDAFRDKARQAEEADQRRAEAEKQLEKHALREAEQATPQGVIESLGQLRGLIGTTVNDLVERMSTQAERLQALQRAIVTQERRLAELHDIEAAAESLGRVTHAYEERRAAAEAALAQRIAALESEHDARSATLEEEHRRRAQGLEADFAQRRAKLEEEMRRTREAWDVERARTGKELAELAEQRTKEREREEAEFAYARDRARARDEDAYHERKVAVERELKERVEAVERDLAARQAAMAGHEQELADLRRRVGDLPAQLEQATARARDEGRESVLAEMNRKAELSALEREWERKVHEERIRHLEENLAGREEKLTELKADLTAALKQVQQLAEKTVEGASLTRAFQSVNQIALEQARRPDTKGKE